MDFLIISTKNTKSGVEIYPKFRLYPKSTDLMIRGGDFYAVWLEDKNKWSTDEGEALRLIDRELEEFANKYIEKHGDIGVRVMYMWDTESGMIDKWHKYCQSQMRDSYHSLDEKLIFSNMETTKKDYSSKRLDYPLEEGDISAWDKLVSTLYSPEERRKIEWTIGAIVTGDSKKIQKFMVLYGSAGTGKSTIINIIEKLFAGYCTTFRSQALGAASNVFALEAFKSNPLVAYDHDGDLSRIDDNTRLNSLVSHEVMTVNEKFKSAYTNSFKCFLVIGTNKPVKITDGKSGLIRRLIDVHPSGKKLSKKDYNEAMAQIEFELGAIAWHCKEVYLSDPSIYDDYIPVAMMGATNDFYNFVVDSYSVFLKQNGTTLKAAWEMFKTYCDEAKVPFQHSQRVFKEELKNYFWDYSEEVVQEGKPNIKHYYSNFRTDIFETKKKRKETEEESKQSIWLNFDFTSSIFDEACAEYPAQYASSKETPLKKWNKATTILEDIDTSKLHYVKVPQEHIVIDFDIRDETGKKSFERNLAAAGKFPPTYAELSKSGAGIHLHYLYSGDVNKLSRIYGKDVEVKVFTGDSSLRRKLTKCNGLAIATIGSGLPLKGDDKVLNFEGFKNETALRTMIKRNLNKEIHPATKPSIDFIYKNLEDAYNSGLRYDVTDMRNAVFAFAAQSTNQSDRCLKIVNKMKFKSDEPSVAVSNEEQPLIFYDVEVFPNLFLVNWKVEGEGKPVVRMINPKPSEIEELLKYRLVGFNCRRYDNHILYARLMGYTNEQLYNLSQKIINSKKGENRDCFFGEAYNISYTDVYDFAATKQSLKKWEIELGIGHKELGLPWDQPVPEEKWIEVAEYCDWDVLATEKVFHHLKGDWTARKILADLAGLSVNDTTNSLTTRIIFGTERHPGLVYTDLATGERTDGTNDIASFPGYEYKDGKNLYRGVDLGYGGYVYAEPGMYGNVALLDVASMHPNSAINLNAFGKYTEHFKDILDARIAIKHRDFDTARTMLNGKLAPYLDDEEQADALAQALKIAINSVYGLTSAGFENPFRDIRNKNNIVALRGALFMKTLQDAVQERGFTVAHIKTDSIKIPDATPEIVQFVMDFGKKYGYTFEHEATYDRMCLVNNAVYIAKYKNADECKALYGYVPEKNKKKEGTWTATGKQFAVPYVFKKLFSGEEIGSKDMCETFSVKSALYLDMNESLPDVSEYEKELDRLETKYKKGKLSDTTFQSEAERLNELIAQGHDYRFVGKVGQFCPVKSGVGGGLLCREQNGKYYAAAGTTGYRWLESELILSSNTVENIDESYYVKLADEAVDIISQYGDFEWFVSDDPYISPGPDFMNIPEDSPEEIPWD